MLIKLTETVGIIVAALIFPSGDCKITNNNNNSSSYVIKAQSKLML